MGIKFSRLILTVILLFAIQTGIRSQDNTMYMLHKLPQANIFNPAVDFPCKFYIELPVISSIKFAYNNTSFTYKDLIKQGTGSRADSLILDLDNIYGKLWKHNAIRAEVQNVILGAGFHWRKYFVSVRISQEYHSGGFYMKDLIKLKDGNWDTSNDSPVSFNLRKNEAKAVGFWGISLGASKVFAEDLRFGARVKYLQGMAEGNMKQSDLNINTSDRPMTVNTNTNYSINASMPLDYTRDSTGQITNATPIFDNFVKNYIFNKNRGLAFDLGVVYDYSTKLKLAASILNIGFVRWKSNSINYKADGNLNLTGVDLEQYTNNQSIDLIQMLRDTIRNSFRFTDTPNKYFTLLPVNVYFGGNYEVTQRLHLGLAGNFYLFNYATFSSLTATINVKPVSFIDLTGSVSYANRTLRNVGFALVLGNEQFNYYFASDMFPINYVVETQSGMYFPYQSRSFNFRFGFNLMFGCKEKKPHKEKRSSGFVCPAYD